MSLCAGLILDRAVRAVTALGRAGARAMQAAAQSALLPDRPLVMQWRQETGRSPGEACHAPDCRPVARTGPTTLLAREKHWVRVTHVFHRAARSRETLGQGRPWVPLRCSLERNTGSGPLMCSTALLAREKHWVRVAHGFTAVLAREKH